MTEKLLDDCFLHDKDRLTHSEALAILRQRVTPIAAKEKILLDKAAGRILAEDVRATRPIPGHTNAAVDGYAFAFADYDSENGSRFPISTRIAAGHSAETSLKKKTAARIFTGAQLPDGTDTVVMQEDTETSDEGGEAWVKIPPGLRSGANRRLAGEDVAKGEILAKQGNRLRPQDLAAIASTGIDQVTCYEPLRVALLSTGDEIIRPGQDLRAGQVYDANAPMLQALIAATGADCMDIGVLPDTEEAVFDALKFAGEKFDALITSGGASRGEEDYIVKTLDRIGSLHMWQIAVKPGRPMSFGQIGDCVVTGLPGNPVAVFVCFLLYVQPLLIRLSGGHWPEPLRFRVKAGFSVKNKKADRREFWRGFLEKNSQGENFAQKFPRDGSGLISSLRAATGLIEVAEDVTGIEVGDEVDFIPLSEFGIFPK